MERHFIVGHMRRKGAEEEKGCASLHFDFEMCVNDTAIRGNECVLYIIKNPSCNFAVRQTSCQAGEMLRQLWITNFQRDHMYGWVQKK